jgi:anti-sigma factor RsiW
MNDEEQLSDYLDGKMAADAKTAFEERIRAEPALARAWRLMRAQKAAVAASSPPMPADLKAALIRDARARAPRRPGPSWFDALAAISAGSWLTGAGAAAFAAAAIAVYVHRPPTPKVRHAPAPTGPISGATWTDPSAAQGLDGLWGDDDGGEKDES